MVLRMVRAIIVLSIGFTATFSMVARDQVKSRIAHSQSDSKIGAASQGKTTALVLKAVEPEYAKELAAARAPIQLRI